MPRPAVTTLARQELTRRWPLVAAAVLLAVGRAACWIVVLFLIRDLLAGALGRTGEGHAGGLLGQGSLPLIAGATLLLYLAASAMAYAATRAQHAAAKQVERALLTRVVTHLLHLSLPYIQAHTRGDLVDAVRNDIIAARGVVLAGIQGLTEGVLAAGVLLALLRLSPELTFWCLLVLPAAALPSVLLGRRLLRTAEEARASRFRLMDTLMELLGGIRTIEGYGAKERAAELGLASASRWQDDQHAVLRDRALAASIFEALGGLSVVLAIALGGYQVSQGALDAPALVAFLVALRSVHRPLDIMNQRWVFVGSSLPSLRRLDELLAQTPAITSAPDARPLETPPELVEVRGVTITRGGSRALDSVSFSIRRGQRLALVGPSGAGKTTTLNLLARLLDPDTGEVLFDGDNLRGLDLEQVRGMTAYVTQTPFVFAASVADNIAYGRPEATRGEVQEAARRCLIHDEIEELPSGYDTPIGPGGRELSVGQLQRICLARALLKAPPLVLLDEATAAIDPASEQAVQRAIKNLSQGRTVVAATHHLAAVADYPQILVLEAGTVLAAGTHEELLESCPRYREMWQAGNNHRGM